MAPRHWAAPFCLLLLLTVPTTLLGLSITADWALSLRLGAETELGNRTRLKGDFGASLLGLVVADALLVVPLMEPAEPWNLDLLLGIPNAAAPVTFAGGMVSVGGSIRVGRRLRTGNRLSLRLGGGYPFFFEPNRPVMRDTNLPLNLWPDIGLELRLTPR